MQKKSLLKNLLPNYPLKIAVSITALLMTVTSGVSADDTEVFFGRNTTQPNVLLLLDISGSMGKTDGTPTTRLDRMKLALTELLSTSNDINIGLMAYSGTGNQLLHAVEPITDNRDRLLQTINNLTVGDSTPSVAALHDAKLYFSGAPLLHKKRAFNSPFAYNCNNPNATAGCWDSGNKVAVRARGARLPDTLAYTLGPASAVTSQPAGHVYRHPHCTEANLDHPSCINEEIRGVANYNSPIVSECQSNHVVLLTDGLPSEGGQNQTRASLIKNDLNINQCENVFEAGFPVGGACASDLAAHMATNDLNYEVNDSTVVTHTIGFALTENYPWLTSVSTAGKGTHHTADTAEGLLEAFENIVSVSQSELNTFVAPAITVDQFTGLSHREDVYLALFKPSARSNWEGNLKRYDFVGNPPILRDFNNQPALDPVNNRFFDSASSWWSDGLEDGNVVSAGGAASQLDADDRNVYTNVDGGILTATSNEVHEGNGAITAAILGVPENERDDVLKWTRGLDVQDSNEDGSTLDTRRMMGDPLHSRPVLITYGKTNNEFDSVAFFGTNQGYLHAVDTQSGQEVFSFIPKELLPNLETFFHDRRRITKLYGLDGDTTTWIQDNNNDGFINNNDKAYLYIGMRRGGNNYYALDVTDKENPELLWTIKGGASGDADFNNLGQSWSKPVLRTISVNGTATKVLIFAGGYDPMQDNSNIRSADSIGNSVFIVDATTGKRLWTADAADYPEMQYSIPSDPNVIDVNGDGIADQIYVGDMGGQVWRFDINNNPTSNNGIAQGGVIATLAADTPRDLRRFFYQPDIALVRGDDGKKFLSISIGSGNRAHPLETTNDDRFYMIRQYAIARAPEGYGMLDKTSGQYRPVTEADLFDITDNSIESNDPIVAADALQELKKSQGWLLKLEVPGEKVLSHSFTVDNGVNFTTYLPTPASAQDVCAPSIGHSRLYRVEVRDGSPSIGDTPASRYSDVPGSGIASSPGLFFTQEGDAYLQEGTRVVDQSNLNRLRRTYWSERAEF